MEFQLKSIGAKLPEANPEFDPTNPPSVKNVNKREKAKEGYKPNGNKLDRVILEKPKLRQPRTAVVGQQKNIVVQEERRNSVLPSHQSASAGSPDRQPIMKSYV